MRLHLLSLLVAGGLALAPAPARAEEPDPEPEAAVEPVEFAPDFGEDPGFLGRLEARPFAHWGLFTERRALPVGLRNSMYDLEGGAFLELFRNLQLLGSFRLLDYEIDSASSDFASQHVGLFFGLSVDF